MTFEISYLSTDTVGLFEKMTFGKYILSMRAVGLFLLDSDPRDPPYVKGSLFYTCSTHVVPV
jgi:hypothetical protein